MWFYKNNSTRKQKIKKKTNIMTTKDQNKNTTNPSSHTKLKTKQKNNNYTS